MTSFNCKQTVDINMHKLILIIIWLKAADKNRCPCWNHLSALLPSHKMESSHTVYYDADSLEEKWDFTGLMFSPESTEKLQITNSLCLYLATNEFTDLQLVRMPFRFCFSSPAFISNWFESKNNIVIIKMGGEIERVAAHYSHHNNNAF